MYVIKEIQEKKGGEKIPNIFIQSSSNICNFEFTYCLFLLIFYLFALLKESYGLFHNLKKKNNYRPLLTPRHFHKFKCIAMLDESMLYRIVYIISILHLLKKKCSMVQKISISAWHEINKTSTKKVKSSMRKNKSFKFQKLIIFLDYIVYTSLFRFSEFVARLVTYVSKIFKKNNPGIFYVIFHK